MGQAASYDVAVRTLAAAVEDPPGQPEGAGPHRYPIRFGTVTGYLQPYDRHLQLLGDHHSAPAMADALAAHLGQLAEQPGTAEPAGQPSEDPDQDAVGRLLGLLVARVHHGGVWASLLAAGAAAPHSLGRRLLPLLETSALLAHPATRHAAGSLIRALGPLLTEPEHAALEDRILAVAAFFDLNDPQQAERAAHARDRLLGCLTPERVQTEQARARLAELAAGAPALHEPMHVEDSTREFTFADHLAAEGVSDAEIPSPVRNILANLYDDVRRAGDTNDDERRQGARTRLPGEIEAILTLTADEPLTGQLANVVDDLVVRATTMASPGVAPDGPAAQRLLDVLLRVAGRASDCGDEP